MSDDKSNSPPPTKENEGDSQDLSQVHHSQHHSRQPTQLQPSMRGQTYSFYTELSEDILIFVNELVYAMTEADPDTMMLKQALQEPDANKFLEAMVKEVEDHINRKHWKLVTNVQMRKAGYDTAPIMAVWSMKCKSPGDDRGICRLVVNTFDCLSSMRA